MHGNLLDMGYIGFGDLCACRELGGCLLVFLPSCSPLNNGSIIVVVDIFPGFGKFCTF
jgi:hypothetical protein